MIAPYVVERRRIDLCIEVLPVETNQPVGPLPSVEGVTQIHMFLEHVGDSELDQV